MAEDQRTDDTAVWLTVEDFRTDWERLVKAAELSIRSLDRSRFDLDALHASLSRDPDERFAWVRDNTRWVPYTGALKGARGVLLSRQGNALDRSLLLADLLQRAGHEVRIASGAPAPGKVADLRSAVLNSMTGEWVGSAPRAQVSDAKIEEAALALGLSSDRVREMAAGAAALQRDRSEAVEAEVDAIFSSIQSLLREAGLTGATGPRARSAAQRIEHSLQTHFWVQMKTAEDSWRDMDVTFESGWLDGLVPIRGASFSPSQVPSGLQHRMAFEVLLLVRHKDGRLERKSVLAHELATASHGLYELNILFASSQNPSTSELLGDYMDPDPAQSPTLERLAGQTEWLPVLLIAGEDPVFQKGFDRGGELISDPVGPGRTVRRSAGAGTSVLESLGTTENDAAGAGTLEEVRLEFTHSGPDETWTEPRTVYLADPAAPDPMALPVAMSRATSFLVLAGLLPEDYASYVQLDRFLQARVGIDYLLASLADDMNGFQTRLAKVVETLDLTHPGLYRLGAARMAAGNDHAIFLSAPTLLSMRGEPFLAGRALGFRQTVDIVSNTVTVVPRVETPALDPFWRAVRMGVADSVLETRVLGEEFNQAGSRAYAHGADSWVAMAPDGRGPALDPFEAGTRSLLEAEFDRGNWVIARRGHEDESYWWRVDPGTGVTLAMTADRVVVGGSATTETMMSAWPLIRVNASFVMTLKAVADCKNGEMGPGARVACYGCAVTAFFASFLDISGALSGGSAALPELSGLGCMGLAEVLDEGS